MGKLRDKLFIGVECVAPHVVQDAVDDFVPERLLQLCGRKRFVGCVAAQPEPDGLVCVVDVPHAVLLQHGLDDLHRVLLVADAHLARDRVS